MSRSLTPIEQYFKEKKALIVDQSLAAARSLRKLLSPFGLSPENVLVTDRYEEAQKLIAQFQPELLISEMNLGKSSGLDLVQQHFEAVPDRLAATSIILSMDSSNVQLGTLAEFQVDGVLLKPYTIQTLQECIQSAVAAKLDPPAYLIKFEEGKRELRASNPEKAAALFEEGLRENSKHAPTYAYFAQASTQLADLEKAAMLLKKGLQADPKSYLCMNGLFELYLGQKKYDLAYETATLLYEKNPPSANRLLDLVRLSIHCSKFEDILSYCDRFKSIDATETTLNRVMIAGLLTSSRYFHHRKQPERAQEALKDAARISLRTDLLQAEVFRYMIENQSFEMADQFYSQMQEVVRKKTEVLLPRLELLFHFKDYGQLITLGQTLVKGKNDTPRVYELMIEASKKLNRSEQVIQNLILEAQSRHRS